MRNLQVSRPRGRGHKRWQKGPLASLLAGGLVLSVVFAAATWAEEGTDQTSATMAPADSRESARHPREKTFMRRQWGVEVLFVRHTSAGYMLEFRYKVLDADKAAALFQRQTKPVLTHVETGAKLIVPTPAKTGALRNSNAPIEGRTYWMFFANPGKLVDPGDLVSIEIGDFLVEGLVVE
jgi:hypothetical protein